MFAAIAVNFVSLTKCNLAGNLTEIREEHSAKSSRAKAERPAYNEATFSFIIEIELHQDLVLKQVLK